ncbi:MAG TPA: SDR family oxidoreductase [Tepidisphaeraceae bacterium]|jgi:3-oxoacyl-[acyl-carrier protein] reductase|nr:SDR family oxidoreductase [Tepidisphaeraceae bacterium]
MMPLLSCRIAVITGASRGLGETIALQFAREGASLALLARGAAGLECLLPKLRATAPRNDQQFRPIPVDLADPNDVDRAVRVCLREFDGVDILVNNAALQGPIGPLEANDWQQWRTAFEVNLFAPARLCQLFIPAMRRRGRGKIINLSGGGATSPRPDFSSYAAAKCALVRLSETLAEELKGDRIDVNAVSPGPMNTRMLDEVLAAGPDAAPREFAAALKRKHEGGSSMEKAAELVAMLASSLSDGISGKLISAVWDDWQRLPGRREELAKSEVYTLRRVLPKEEQKDTNSCAARKAS